MADNTTKQQRDWFSDYRIAWRKAVISDTRLDATVARVILYIEDEYLNHKSRKATPAIKTLAEHFGKARNTIKAALRRAEEVGYVIIDRSGSGRSTHTYTLNFPAEMTPPKTLDDAPRGQPTDPSGGLRGQPADPQGVKIGTLRGQPTDPEPIREPIGCNMGEDIPPTPLEEDRRKSAAVSPTAADHPPASEKTEGEPSGFAEWWDQYPTGWQAHETARPDKERRRAERAWRALLRAGDDPRTVIRETMKFSQHVAEALDAGAEARFIAQPSNFLKGRKWETPERWPRAPGNVVPISEYRSGGQREAFDPVAWAAEFQTQSAAASNWWRQ
ncbi:hypothetical protein A3731_00695 [Roseovarius sp. HI0049]|nr:hypothetical protein A3731_00695 [Roseovarius sp. HI0049]